MSKRLLALLILTAALQPLSFVLAAHSPSPTTTLADRKKCCHGCGSYGCNRTNCGDTCGKGPNCRGCWKSCVSSSARVTLNPASLTLALPAALIQADQGNPDIKVWVNTASGVYHCPGTRWYGATKHGTYMRQADAQKKGYRPAYGRVCH